MRELLGKIGRFCENHVEKIVLVVVGIFCAWLFFTWVIFSPYVVTIDKRQLSPGQVDRYVQDQAQELEGLLSQVDRDPGQTPYTSIVTGPIDPCNPVIAGVFVNRPAPESFASLFESPLAYITPEHTTVLTNDRDKNRPKYFLPQIGQAMDVAVTHIRAAAYIPLTEINTENKYDSAETEPNDIDLVTVEAKFDVENLYRQFHAYFAGTEVEKQQWRDPCLAKPVFAALQLQRQTLLDNGTWSQWTDIPRSRVQSNKELFSIIENVDDLPPGGLGVRLMQYNNPLVTMELLQPSAYQIASADDDWFPPSFYDKYKSLQRKVEQEERRQEREDREKDRDRDTGRTGGRRDTGRGTTGAVGGGGRRRDTGGGQGLYGGGATGGRGRSRDRGRTGVGGDAMGGAGGRRSGRRGGDDMGMGLYGDPSMMGGADGRMAPSTDEVYLELAQNSLTYATDMTKLDEPILVWRFDDTTEPGHTYRYRLRVGVFNPVAGTDKVAQEDDNKKNQVILWSDFSDITEPVKIPKMLYFFAKSVQDRTDTAVVEVARYTLGHWRTEDFQVKVGEVIGKEMEPKEEEERRDPRLRGDRQAGMPGRNMDMMAIGGPGMTGAVGLGVNTTNQLGQNETPRPDIIDFRTYNILIDLVQVSDLGPQLHPRAYHDMLYSNDGVTINHMPVSSSNWSSDLRSTYQEIKAEERKKQAPFRSFGDSGMRNRRGTGMDGGMGLYGGGMNPY